MKVLTTIETEQWCRDHVVSLGQGGHPTRPESTEEFQIPPDTGKRVALVRQHAQAFLNEPEVLVWFTGWSVWPSGEHMPMFDRFRLSYGESRPLIEAPGHVLAGSETEELVSLLSFGVLFLWDLYVITPECTVMLFLSHDECGFRTR